MFTVFRKQMDWAGRPLTIETGRVARQADGAALVTYGDTVVLATACFEKKQKEGLDFFPLTVNYQEKFYAGGRIPGGFFKREGRPTEKETLICRLIDRPIRPLFVKGFKNETQVICNVLSSDGENDSDIVALIAASAALTLSGAPFMGPIGAARVGYMDGEYVINPTHEERVDAALDMVVAGTREGVLMVESEAKELSEDIMLGAVMHAHEHFQPVIDAIIEIAEAAAKPGFEFAAADTKDMEDKIAKAFGKDIEKAYSIKEKADRRAMLDELKAQAMEKFGGDEGEFATQVKSVFKEAEASVLRGAVLKTGKRIDGRDTRTVRPIVGEVDVLPRTHGSAMFTRGETQAIVVTTLGSGRDEQMIDSMEGEFKDRFMMHYNFPPFCVGEVGRMGGTSRREMGHGRLARRAIEGLLPTKEAFPYTIRVVSEITESNGSSSMASVCGASMALMAAGVPLARPVAGIAMGLVKEGDDFTVLSDIMGDEDHLGDMDFKVAGTDQGLTALQMDIKITSITEAIMKQALEQAQEGRLHILGKMAAAISESREEVAESAPGMTTFKIDKEKIRDIIGTGGKIIRGLQEDTGCTIDIQDDGTITVSGVNRADLKDCVDRIHGIVAMPEAGVDYTGEVTRVTDFGAFIRVLPSHEGLLHISEIVPVRIGQVDDVLKEGEIVTVKCVSLEDNGKIRLTMKEIPQTAEIQARVEAVVEAGGTEPNAATIANRERKDERGSRDRGRGGPRRRSA